MKMLIVGAGAIGQWIGANLLQAGQGVVFVGRERFAEAARRDGLHAQLPDGTKWSLPSVQVAGAVEQAASHAPFDAIALCVKAYAVEDTLRELQDAGLLVSPAPLVCFQNGIGAEAMVARFVDGTRVIAGTLTSAVSLVDATTVKLERAKGGVGLAANVDMREIADAIAAAPLLNARQYDDADAMKWSKLLLNLVGNATSALFRRRVAELLADDVIAKIEMQQLREAAAVMRAAGIQAVDLPGAPSKWFVRAIHMLSDAPLRWTLQQFFARARGDKWPSFYYDAVNQTGRSEVTWLNGAVSEWGRRFNVPSPVNDALTRLVLDAVNGHSQPADVLLEAFKPFV